MKIHPIPEPKGGVTQSKAQRYNAMFLSKPMATTALLAAVIIAIATSPVTAGRQKTDVVSGLASSDNEGGYQVQIAAGTSQTVRSERDHFRSRLTRYVRLAGVAQYLSGAIALPRGDIFQNGASEYQDRSCQKGYEASHILRLSIKEEAKRKIKNFDDNKFKNLKDYIGRTHCMPKYANQFTGLGGAIDKAQGEFLAKMANINFKLNAPNSDAKKILNELKDRFVDEIQKEMNKEKRSADEKARLKEAKLGLEVISVEYLYTRGKEGASFNIDDSA